VRTPSQDLLAQAVADAGGSVTRESDQLRVRGLSEDQVGDIAFANRVPVYHLAAAKVSLEQAFMELTADSVDYHAGLPVSQEA
jgi:ABC-2 type transport system ATP-binding protein